MSESQGAYEELKKIRIILNRIADAMENKCKPMNSRRDRPCPNCGACHCPELPEPHTHFEPESNTKVKLTP